MKPKTVVMPIFLMITALLCGVRTEGQETNTNHCEAYFIAWRIWDPDLGIIPNMTKKQVEWWKKKGQKKYPEVCEDMQKATFLILTVQWTEEQKRSVMRRHTADTTGQVSTIVGMPGSGPGQPGQPIYGPQMQTFVTSWWEREVETFDQAHVAVLLFKTKDGKAVDSGGELQLMASPKGIQLSGPNASKIALEWIVDSISVIATREHRSKL